MTEDERNFENDEYSCYFALSKVEHRENVFYESSGRFTLEESDIRNLRPEGGPSNENDSRSGTNHSGQDNIPVNPIPQPGIGENEEQSPKLNYADVDIDSEESQSSRIHGAENKTRCIQVAILTKDDDTVLQSTDIENIDGSHNSLDRNLSTTDYFCKDKLPEKPIPTARMTTKQKQTTELNYIEVEFNPAESGSFQVRGLENKTNYVQVHILPKQGNREDPS